MATPELEQQQSHSELDESSARMYVESLDVLASNLPEIANDYEELKAPGIKLITEFEVNPEFFSDGSKALFFAALAQRKGRLDRSRAQDDFFVEQRFINDALIMLATEDSRRWPEFKPQLDSGDLEEETVRALHHRYTDRPLTKELLVAIEDGLLDGIKERLGVNDANQEPYQTLVLSVGTQSSTYGMKPTRPQVLSDSVQSLKSFNSYKEDLGLFQSYEAGLAERWEAFWRALGMPDYSTDAWHYKFSDAGTICIPMPVAEKILYTDQPRSGIYDERNRAEDLSILEHEYAHTQGCLAVDGRIFYGIGFEEKRVTHYAKDYSYIDVDRFYQRILNVTGVDISQHIIKHRIGEDKSLFYKGLAYDLGLQQLLEIALFAPKNYRKHAPRRSLYKRVMEYLGDEDALLGRLHQAQSERLA